MGLSSSFLASSLSYEGRGFEYKLFLLLLLSMMCYFIESLYHLLGKREETFDTFARFIPASSYAGVASVCHRPQE